MHKKGGDTGKGENEKGKKLQKRSAAGEKVKPGTQSDSDQKEQAEQALSDIQGKQKQRHEHCECKQNIQHDCHARETAADCPKKVVNDAKHKSKQTRACKLEALQADGKLHQPNRRAKKPPVATSSS